MFFIFTDGRSKRVAFVSHCILNQNAISDGTADFACSNIAVIRELINSNVSIVQLPCPEMTCLGLDRNNELGAESPVVVENTRIRRELKGADNMRDLRSMTEFTMRQIRDYLKHGFEVVCIIGMNRSPSCGVDTTSDNNAEINGKGVFMELLSEALKEENINVPIIGIKADEKSIQKVKDIVAG